MTDREKLIDLCDTNNGWVDEVPAEQFADHLLANGVTFATDTKAGDKWTPTAERLPDEFVSVLGHMTDAGEFPAVRECYRVGGVFFFPALMDRHPVDKWMEMPKEG